MTKLNQKQQQDNNSSVQDAAKKMAVHFSKTGTYKTEDLNLVLGDPRDGVGETISDSYSFCSEKVK